MGVLGEDNIAFLFYTQFLRAEAWHYFPKNQIFLGVAKQAD